MDTYSSIGAISHFFLIREIKNVKILTILSEFAHYFLIILCSLHINSFCLFIQFFSLAFLRFFLEVLGSKIQWSIARTRNSSNNNCNKHRVKTRIFACSAYASLKRLHCNIGQSTTITVEDCNMPCINVEWLRKSRQ